MRNWLLWTGIVEIANIGIFTFFWWRISLKIPGNCDLISILGLLTLNVILLEGGIYWLLARTHFFRKTSARIRYFVLITLYGLNSILLLVFPVGLVVLGLIGSLIALPDLLFGAALYLFGIGEFIHYFVYKINMRRYEREYSRRKHRFVPARLLRELRRVQNQLSLSAP
jgi:hypothetical protein